MSLPRGLFYSDEPVPLSTDSPSGYDDQLRAWRIAAKDEAIRTAKLNLEIVAVPNYIKWLQGQQWDLRRPRYRSKFFDNKVEKARIDNLAVLTNARPTIDCYSENPLLVDTANTIQQVIQQEWVRRDMDLSLVTVTDIAMLWGTGFWKIGAAMPGFMRVTPCGPDNVMPIQPGWDIQDSAAILYRNWKTPDYFKQTYPFRSAGIERESSSSASATWSAVNRPSQMDEYTWNALSPQIKKLLGVKSINADTPAQAFHQAIELQEFFIDDHSRNESKSRVLVRNPYLSLEQHNYWYYAEPGQRLYPRKRLVVFGGERCVYDGPSPYWHGLYPFGCLRLNPNPWSFWGLSEYRNLIPLNAAINEIGAGTLDLIKRCLNPTAVTKEGAIPLPAWNSFFSDMPGSKLRMTPMANPQTDFRYLENPQLPNYVFESLMRYLMPEFDRMSGQLDVTSMLGKKQIPGGDTIEQMKDSQQLALQLKGRYLEAFLRDSGTQAVSNVCQFYTAGRRAQMLGVQGIADTDYDRDPKLLVPCEAKQKEAWWKNFGIVVKPGSLHSGAKDRDRQMSLALFKLGAISRSQLLRTFDFTNIDEIQAELKKEALERATGGLPPEMLQQLQQVMQAMGGAGGGGAKPGGGLDTRMSRGARTGDLSAA